MSNPGFEIFFRREALPPVRRRRVARRGPAPSDRTLKVYFRHAPDEVRFADIGSDEVAIREVLKRAAAKAGMSFEELARPIPRGRLTAPERARRTVLASAVRELRDGGATLDAIGRVIGATPLAVFRLEQAAQSSSA